MQDSKSEWPTSHQPRLQPAGVASSGAQPRRSSVHFLKKIIIIWESCRRCFGRFAKERSCFCKVSALSKNNFPSRLKTLSIPAKFLQLKNRKKNSLTHQARGQWVNSVVKNTENTASSNHASAWKGAQTRRHSISSLTLRVKEEAAKTIPGALQVLLGLVPNNPGVFQPTPVSVNKPPRFLPFPVERTSSPPFPLSSHFSHHGYLQYGSIACTKHGI